MPEVSSKIADGELNLSQLTQVQKCLKEQNQEPGVTLSFQDTMQVLEKIKSKNSFETQRILALEFNQPVQIHEKIKPQKDNSVRIELTLAREQFAELEQAKSLLSHVCPDGNLKEVIYTLAKIYNKKKLQGRSYSSTHSTQRVIVTASISTPSEGILSPSPMPETTSSSTSEPTSPLQPLSPSTFCQRPRKYIPVKTKRSLLEKARYCCEYFEPSSKKRCTSKYQLEVDHIQPWSLGGSNEPENLRVLCKTHNNLMAVKAGLNNSRKA